MSVTQNHRNAVKADRHAVRILIQDNTLEGIFFPGERLKQAQIAKRLDVSVGLVREALFELKSTGLVETIDNRGVFVSKLTIRKIKERNARAHPARRGTGCEVS